MTLQEPDGTAWCGHCRLLACWVVCERSELAFPLNTFQLPQSLHTPPPPVVWQLVPNRALREMIQASVLPTAAATEDEVPGDTAEAQEYNFEGLAATEASVPQSHSHSARQGRRRWGYHCEA